MSRLNPAAPPETRLLRLLRLWPIHLLLAALLLALDYFTGSAIQFPITFVIPVVLASWFCLSSMGYLLALALPLFRLGFVLSWGEPVAPWPLLVNVWIRIAVLVLIAYLARKGASLARQVKVLEGIIPVCSFCKNIRDEKQEWIPMETYLYERTDADFSHGICPECMKIHYGDIVYPKGK